MKYSDNRELALLVVVLALAFGFWLYVIIPQINYAFGWWLFK